MPGGDERHHVQPFQVLRSTGPQALKGFEGELVVSRLTGPADGEDGIKVFAGLAPDLFAGDAQALGRFRTALERETFRRGGMGEPQEFFRPTQRDGNRARGSHPNDRQ